MAYLGSFTSSPFKSERKGTTYESRKKLIAKQKFLGGMQEQSIDPTRVKTTVKKIEGGGVEDPIRQQSYAISEENLLKLEAERTKQAAEIKRQQLEEAQTIRYIAPPTRKEYWVEATREPLQQQTTQRTLPPIKISPQETIRLYPTITQSQAQQFLGTVPPAPVKTISAASPEQISALAEYKKESKREVAEFQPTLLREATKNVKEGVKGVLKVKTALWEGFTEPFITAQRIDRFIAGEKRQPVDLRSPEAYRKSPSELTPVRKVTGGELVQSATEEIIYAAAGEAAFRGVAKGIQKASLARKYRKQLVPSKGKGIEIPKETLRELESLKGVKVEVEPIERLVFAGKRTVVAGREVTEGVAESVVGKPKTISLEEYKDIIDIPIFRAEQTVETRRTFTSPLTKEKTSLVKESPVIKTTTTRERIIPVEQIPEPGTVSRFRSDFLVDGKDFVEEQLIISEFGGVRPDFSDADVRYADKLLGNNILDYETFLLTKDEGFIIEIDSRYLSKPKKQKPFRVTNVFFSEVKPSRPQSFSGGLTSGDFSGGAKGGARAMATESFVSGGTQSVYLFEEQTFEQPTINIVIEEVESIFEAPKQTFYDVGSYGETFFKEPQITPLVTEPVTITSIKVVSPEIVGSTKRKYVSILGTTTSSFFDSKNVLSIEPISKVDITTTTISKLTTETKTTNIPAIDTVLDIKPIIDTSLLTESILDTQLDTKLDIKPINDFFKKGRIKPKPKDEGFDFFKPKPKIDLDFPQLKRRSNRVDGYFAQNKSGGRWVTINKKPLKRENALSLAARAADNSTARSIRIKKSKKKITPRPTDNYFFLNNNKFRESKKKGVFIEKTANAIDTKGEFEGITVKGWIANSRKSKSSKLRFGL